MSQPTPWRIACKNLIHRAAVTGAVWIGAAAQCWAQVGGAADAEKKGYVPSYLIIFFAVGLGLLVICRSGKRTTSFRYEE